MQLVGLDLSGNKLSRLDVLRDLRIKFPQLEILSLKDNEVSSLTKVTFRVTNLLGGAAWTPLSITYFRTFDEKKLKFYLGLH